ncbi:hypothetical protein SAMN05421787_101903 [Virgibacillus pantothenticus]|nr:hypothetical protein SAMN05421787_101903 [Virgibacillus pantothenticus]
MLIQLLTYDTTDKVELIQYGFSFYFIHRKQKEGQHYRSKALSVNKLNHVNNPFDTRSIYLLVYKQKLQIPHVHSQRFAYKSADPLQPLVSAARD